MSMDFDRNLNDDLKFRLYSNDRKTAKLSKESENEVLSKFTPKPKRLEDITTAFDRISLPSSGGFSNLDNVSVASSTTIDIGSYTEEQPILKKQSKYRRGRKLPLTEVILERKEIVDDGLEDDLFEEIGEDITLFSFASDTREEVVFEKERQLIDREKNLILAKQELLEQKDEILEKRDQQKKIRENLIRKFRALKKMLVNKERKIRERLREIGEREIMIKEREQASEHKERELERFERELQKKRALFEARELEMAETQSRINLFRVKQKEIDIKQGKINSLKREVEQKKRRLGEEEDQIGRIRELLIDEGRKKLKKKDFTRQITTLEQLEKDEQLDIFRKLGIDE